MYHYNRYVSFKEKLIKIESKTDTTLNSIYNILLQVAVFSDIGATIKEIAATINKSEKTVGTKIRNISSDIILIDDSSRPYHYKLNIRYF